MKVIKAIPLEEVNGIKFGTGRDKVREKLGAYKEFKKTPFSENSTDDFGYCHVYYDNENKFEAIEIFDAEVYIGDRKVFPVSVDDLSDIIDDFDDELISISKSIGIYAPDNEPESILFGCKGYYEFD